jgi:hypothetical protein
MGLEAEFTLVVNGRPRRPEALFRTPQEFVRERMLPRTGRSFHLPSGGAVYFDTGVIEVATPIIELEPGCCVRAVRSLWEQIRYLRAELDVLESASGNRLQLAGFSAHYNLSFPAAVESANRTTDKLAWLLCHLLPLPAMLLAANRLSTGIGVRPRDGRIEITADFTPDPDLMIAAVSTTMGLSWSVMQWEDYEKGRLETVGVPVIKGFKPRKHTSRKGWLARFDCYPRSPFTADVNAPDWQFRDGTVRSLRDAARVVMSKCDEGHVESMGDAESFDHVLAVLEGRARSLLDFESRPSSYEDVGRVIPWKRRSRRSLPPSRYERVIERIISKRRLHISGCQYRPVQMIGWYEVALQDERTGVRRIFNLDELAKHCGF